MLSYSSYLLWLAAETSEATIATATQHRPIVAVPANQIAEVDQSELSASEIGAVTDPNVAP